MQHSIKMVIAFSTVGDRIYMRTYQVDITGNNLLEEDGNIDVAEIAPKANFIIRRTRFAEPDTWKEAVKQPKPITRK